MNLWIHGSDAWTKSDQGGYSSLWRQYHGYWTDWSKVHELFAGARVNFNSHIKRGRDYLNDRAPMVMGAGGFMIMDRQPGLDGWFVENQEVVYYDSLEDLLAKTMYYLRRPDDRERIGRAAREKVLAEHTYAVRAKQLLEILDARGMR